MQFNPKEHVSVLHQISPQDVTSSSTVNGTSVDARGFEYALFIFSSGTIGAAGNIVCDVQEDTVTAFSSPTAVTGATLTFATADDDITKAISVRTRGREQFLRSRMTASAAAVTHFGSATCVLFNPQYQDEQLKTTEPQIQA